MLRPSTRDRHARVGHGADRLRRELHHPLNGFEGGLGADRAVEPDDVGRPLVQQACEDFGFGAAGQVAVIVDSDLRDDRDLGPGGFPRAPSGLRASRRGCRRFREPADRRRRPASTSACSRKMARASAKEVGPSGSMCAPSGPIAPATKAFSRAASRARRTPAWLICMQLFGKAECAQAHAVGAERVRFKNLRAGLDVFLVNLPDHVGRGDIQLVETAVDEHPASIKHGAHGAVGDHGAARELVAELFGAGCRG